MCLFYKATTLYPDGIRSHDPFIAPVSLVAGRDNTIRPRSQGNYIIIQILQKYYIRISINVYCQFFLSGCFWLCDHFGGIFWRMYSNTTFCLSHQDLSTKIVKIGFGGHGMQINEIFNIVLPNEKWTASGDSPRCKVATLLEMAADDRNVEEGAVATQRIARLDFRCV
jgi:hypothetical protein